MAAVKPARLTPLWELFGREARLDELDPDLTVARNEIQANEQLRSALEGFLAHQIVALGQAAQNNAGLGEMHSAAMALAQQSYATGLLNTLCAQAEYRPPSKPPEY